jgi:hypothetical protein
MCHCLLEKLPTRESALEALHCHRHGMPFILVLGGRGVDCLKYRLSCPAMYSQAQPEQTCQNFNAILGGVHEPGPGIAMVTVGASEIAVLSCQVWE